MMKKVFSILLVLAVAVVIYSSVSDSPSANYEMNGYFKSSANARVVAYEALAPVDKVLAQQILSNAASTAGAPTLAVIYVSDPAPGDRLTLQGSFVDASQVIYSPPFNNWKWRLRINPAGQRTIDKQE